MVMYTIDEFVQTKATPAVSVRTIAKKLGIKRRKVRGYLKNSGKFEIVDPLDGGSNKQHSNSWKPISK